MFSDETQRQYVVEGTVNGAGRALQWFAEQTNTPAYQKKLDYWLQNIKNPPLFINGISGVGSPFWLAKLDSFFIGEGNIASKFVAIVESILFLTTTNLHCMEQLNLSASQIIVSGGLSNSSLLCQVSGQVHGKVLDADGEARLPKGLSVGQVVDGEVDVESFELNIRRKPNENRSYSARK